MALLVFSQYENTNNMILLTVNFDFSMMNNFNGQIYLTINVNYKGGKVYVQKFNNWEKVVFGCTEMIHS